MWVSIFKAVYKQQLIYHSPGSKLATFLQMGRRGGLYDLAKVKQQIKMLVSRPRPNPVNHSVISVFSFPMATPLQTDPKASGQKLRRRKRSWSATQLRDYMPDVVFRNCTRSLRNPASCCHYPLQSFTAFSCLPTNLTQWLSVGGHVPRTIVKGIIFPLTSPQVK